jgi:hypothetical protein
VPQNGDQNQSNTGLLPPPSVLAKLAAWPVPTSVTATSGKLFPTGATVACVVGGAWVVGVVAAAVDGGAVGAVVAPPAGAGESLPAAGLALPVPLASAAGCGNDGTTDVGAVVGLAATVAPTVGAACSID